MATEYNITQKQYNGTDYDTLYPQTTSQQVLLNDSAISYTGSATVNGALTKQQAEIDSLNSKISLSKTYTSNSVVLSSDFARMDAFKSGNMLFLNGNLGATNGAATSEFVEIGRISGWSAISNVMTSTTCQVDGTKVMTIRVTANGVILVYSAQTILGSWYRFFICVPCA